MKLTTPLLNGLIGLVLAAQVAAAKPAQPADFSFQQPLSGNMVPQQRYRLELPPNLYGDCFRFPNDLRIFSENDKAWPFYLWRPEHRIYQNRLAFEKLNLGRPESSSPVLQLDLAITSGEQGEESPRHNALQLETTGHDFLRRVEVYGSHDSRPAERTLLGEGYVIHQGRSDAVQNQRIEYNHSSFRFLHVRIYPDARNSLEPPFAISRIQVLDEGEHEPPSYSTRPATPMPTPENEKPATDRATLLLDTGFENLPIHRLSFTCTTPEFVRQLSIYGRNHPEEPWIRACTGSIFRTKKNARLHLLLGNPLKARYLKIEEHHYDDAPLNQLQIQLASIADFLVFEALSNDPAQLYYGSDRVPPAVFDLKQRSEHHLPATLPLVGLGERVDNPRATPFRMQKWMVTLCVALCAGLVLYVILNMMKKMNEDAL